MSDRTLSPLENKGTSATFGKSRPPVSDVDCKSICRVAGKTFIVEIMDLVRTKAAAEALQKHATLRTW